VAPILAFPNTVVKPEIFGKILGVYLAGEDEWIGSRRATRKKRKQRQVMRIDAAL
jgi:hypothetical protein